MLDKQDRLLRRERVWRGLWRLRQWHVAHARRPRALTSAVTQQRPRRRQTPTHRGGRQSPRAQFQRKRLEILAGDGIKVEAATSQIGLEIGEVGAIGRNRVRGRVALKLQRREEVRNPRILHNGEVRSPAPRPFASAFSFLMGSDPLRK